MEEQEVNNVSVVDESVPSEHSNGESKRGTPFYIKIKQRHKLGEKQELPEVNWLNLFYDLFFVGLAFNLGHLIAHEFASLKSMLYFVGLFFPAMNAWNMKTHMEARYVIGNDICHRLIVYIQLFALAMAVLHVSELEKMSNPREYINMVIFCSSIMIQMVLHDIQMKEIYSSSDASPEAKFTSKADLLGHCIPMILYIIASFVSGTAYFGDNYYSDDTRDEYPVYLLIAAAIISTIVRIVEIVYYFEEGSYVPWNIEYTIHRHGEWIMLMLGEIVLSLVTVEEQSTDKYYFTVSSGIAFAILMQYHHFQQEPKHPKDHALHRNKNAGIAYVFINEIYSAALVSIGCSYRLILTHPSIAFPQETLEGTHEESHEHRRHLSETQSNMSTLYCSSVAIALFSLDLMTFAHKGSTVKNNRQKTFGGLLKVGSLVAIIMARILTSNPVYLCYTGTFVILVTVIGTIISDIGT